MILARPQSRGRCKASPNRNQGHRLQDNPAVDIDEDYSIQINQDGRIFMGDTWTLPKEDLVDGDTEQGRLPTLKGGTPIERPELGRTGSIRRMATSNVVWDARRGLEGMSVPTPRREVCDACRRGMSQKCRRPVSEVDADCDCADCRPVGSEAWSDGCASIEDV